jgi:LysM repeat protein
MRVQSGDCLSSIALNHNLSLESLLSMNEGLTATSTIGIGDQIVVNGS